MPVLGGIVVLAVIAGFTWAIAAYISSGGTDATERLARTTFTIGNVETLAETVADEGPLLFYHEGTIAADGWRVYWAYPADREPSCLVEQVVGTSDFVDCDGRTVDVTELSPPDAGVFPRVQDRTTLIVDLRGATSSP